MRAAVQADGLGGGVYPFRGLGIVGLVSLRGLAAVAGQPPLLAAAGIGGLLVLGPLAPFSVPRVGKLLTAVPVVAGFGLALYPLWASGSIVGIAVSTILAALAAALIVLPWERIPRVLHSVSPIGGLAIALVPECQFRCSGLDAF